MESASGGRPSRPHHRASGDLSTPPPSPIFDGFVCYDDKFLCGGEKVLTCAVYGWLCSGDSVVVKIDVGVVSEVVIGGCRGGDTVM